MRAKAATTVLGARDAVQRAWEASDHRLGDATATYSDAPGDRGTEIHLELEAGRAAALTGATAKVKDALRRFKAEVETGEVPRSDAAPDGERAERKLKQRPAQPLPREKAGV
jgi:hypothetical protein